MGKRRSAAKKSYGGAKGVAMDYGGSGGNNSTFSAFDFSEDDHLVEVVAREALAKFAKSPRKKPVRRSKPIDKYEFLESVAQGIPGELKHFGDHELDIDATDGVFQDTTFGTNVGMPLGSLNYESGALSSLERQSSECTSGVKSCSARRKPGCHTAGKNHKQVFYLDSDEDEGLESGSIDSSINMGENEGLLKKQSSKYGANINECETVVVVSPHYVKHGRKYYTRCVLTFSQRCIQLKGSPHCDRKRTFCVEWPTSDILNIEHQQYENDKAEIIILYLGYKDASADETDNSSSVELEFVILDDPRWSEKQKVIKSLDLKYKDCWKTNVMECCFEESLEEVVYPEGDPDAVIISRRDIERLRPKTFINDTIIDFYFRYLLNRIKAEEQHRFHFFNTFFFQKLVGGSDAFRSVRKWTRNVDLFEKDFIFVPVNFSLHWSLIIICHPGEVANFKNKDMDKSSKVPRILHMDSIRGSHREFENLIRRYLCEEWKERGNECKEEIAEKFLHLESVSLQLPQQENSFDCGLFLLHYAELFLELVSNCSTSKYIDSLNRDWFFPAEVSLKKRDQIRKLIHKLFQDNAVKDPQVASNDKYLQKLGRGLGKSSTRSVLQNVGKNLCHATNLSSTNDLDIQEQQCFAPKLKQRNIGQSKLVTPINLVEEASAEKPRGQQRDKGSTHITDEHRPPLHQLNRLMAEETSSVESEVTTLAVESDVAFPSERQKESMMSEENLAACMVEDSEDETEGESIIRFRRATRHFLTKR